MRDGPWPEIRVLLCEVFTARNGDRAQPGLVCLGTLRTVPHQGVSLCRLSLALNLGEILLEVRIHLLREVIVEVCQERGVRKRVVIAGNSIRNLIAEGQVEDYRTVSSLFPVN